MIVNLPFAEMTISPALAYYPPGASYGPRTLTDFELVWLTAGPLPEPERPEPAALTAALDYVRRQWAAAMRPLALRELAAAACVSPSYLSRVFRKQYGCGPSAALELVRLERARTMLARSNLTVSQVAAACGFADPLYFSRRFRAAHGIAPSAYRDKGAAADPPDLPGLLSLSRRLALE